AAGAAVDEAGVAVVGERGGDAVLVPAAVAAEVRRTGGFGARRRRWRLVDDHGGGRGRVFGRLAVGGVFAAHAVLPGALGLARSREFVAERFDAGRDRAPRAAVGTVLERVAEAEVGERVGARPGEREQAAAVRARAGAQTRRAGRRVLHVGGAGPRGFVPDVVDRGARHRVEARLRCADRHRAAGVAFEARLRVGGGHGRVDAGFAHHRGRGAFDAERRRGRIDFDRQRPGRGDVADFVGDGAARHVCAAAFEGLRPGQRGAVDATGGAAVGKRRVAVVGERDGDAVLVPAAVAGEVRGAVGVPGRRVRRRPVHLDRFGFGRVFAFARFVALLDAVVPRPLGLAFAGREGVFAFGQPGRHGAPAAFGVLVLEREACAQRRRGLPAQREGPLVGCRALGQVRRCRCAGGGDLQRDQAAQALLEARDEAFFGVFRARAVPDGLRVVLDDLGAAPVGDRFGRRGDGVPDPFGRRRDRGIQEHGFVFGFTVPPPHLIERVGGVRRAGDDEVFA